MVSKSFLGMILSTSIWNILIAISTLNNSLDTAFVLAKINHAFGIIISLCFLIFTDIYTKLSSKKTVIFFSIFGFTIILLIFLSSLIISGSIDAIGLDYPIWTYGKLFYLFDICFISMWSFGIKKLFLYQKNNGNENNTIFIWATILGIIPPLIFTIILPQLNFYDLYWLGSVSTFIWTMVVINLINKFDFLNTKIAKAHLIIFILWAITITRILLTRNARELIYESILLAIVIMIGILLIRISNKSYNLEKRAQRNLENLSEAKNQFIRITHHNLRSPLNHIEYITTKMECELPQHKKYYTELRKATSSIERLVEGIYSISSLNYHSQILTISDVIIEDMITNILEDLRIDIEELKIITEFNKNRSHQTIIGDSKKLREVFFIVIENAIKYNHENGFIKIKIESIDRDVHITIFNTGMGIEPNHLESIFDNYLYRSNEARAKNPNGMGIGISISKSIIIAHHGQFNISSQGKNLGATVHIVLPINLREHFLD